MAKCERHKLDEKSYQVKKTGEMIVACPNCRRTLEGCYGPMDEVKPQIPEIRDRGRQPWQDRLDM
jgi:hypothetical protein